ncbi:hypothetical protein TeGR_g10979 [Tetraparma gracilis]|uniref:Ketoreductase domain-containing protein n=1 Tax=Tetraparma gracilis TaxID=2962635 RepID=A0ABQ6ME48_9STRA|nr:hypothetical protein TeGR_g10979 [Tetraparma gracilis]
MGYAVVTGASSGLGRSLSVELARRKIPLVLVARNAAALSALASDLARCYKIQAIPVPLDLSDPAAVPQLTRKLAELDKPVDILVSNAGSCERSPFLASKRSAPSLRLMVNSATELARAVLPGMADRKRGRVLFVGSLMSAAGTGPGVAQYAASKAYLATFARSLAKEMEPHGVGVTLTSPGAIRSGFFDSMDGDALCNRIPFYPMSPEAVADRSVRAMVAGLTEVMPGWQNRALAAGTPF